MATDPRNFQVPQGTPTENKMRVGLGESFIQVEATIIDPRGLDRLIEVLQENRKFLPNAGAIGT